MTWITDFGTFEVASAAASKAGIAAEVEFAYETFHIKTTNMSMHLLDTYFDWGPGKEVDVRKGAAVGLGLLAEDVAGKDGGVARCGVQMACTCRG